MKTVTVSMPELFLIAGTRALLGAGIGLLVGERMSDSTRHAVGWTLFAVGVATTVPLAAQVLTSERPSGAARKSNGHFSPAVINR